jgi:hypothetical protein
MNAWRVTAMTACAVMLLTGAEDCGGEVGTGSVKEAPTVTARLSCGGDRILASANGSGWPKNKEIRVDFELRGPTDDNDSAKTRSSPRGSWSAHSNHWTPVGDGNYELRVDANAGGQHADDSTTCERE